MANNFKISLHRAIDNLQINLKGDFDGNSAFELLNILQAYLDNTTRVFVNTSGLKKIHPFGQEVFNHHLAELKKHRPHIRFVGDNAEQIAPEEIRH